MRGLYIFAVCLLPLITFSSPRSNFQVGASLTTPEFTYNESARDVNLEKRHDIDYAFYSVGTIGDHCTATVIHQVGPWAWIVTHTDCVYSRTLKAPIPGVDFTYIQRDGKGNTEFRAPIEAVLLTNNVAFAKLGCTSNYRMGLRNKEKLNIGDEMKITFIIEDQIFQTTGIIIKLDKESFQLRTSTFKAGAPVYDDDGYIYGVISKEIRHDGDNVIVAVAEITSDGMESLSEEIRVDIEHRE